MPRDTSPPRKGSIGIEILRVRVQRDWALALVRALTEPTSDGDHGKGEAPTTPIEQLAARAAADAWPHVEELVRPIFESVAGDEIATGERLEELESPAPVPPSRRAVWLSAEEAASVLGITAHTLRRLARVGKSPITVRRVGGRWWYSASDIERLFEAGQ